MQTKKYRDQELDKAAAQVAGEVSGGTFDLARRNLEDIVAEATHIFGKEPAMEFRQSSSGKDFRLSLSVAEYPAAGSALALVDAMHRDGQFGDKPEEIKAKEYYEYCLKRHEANKTSPIKHNRDYAAKVDESLKQSEKFSKLLGERGIERVRNFSEMDKRDDGVMVKYDRLEVKLNGRVLKFSPDRKATQVFGTAPFDRDASGVWQRPEELDEKPGYAEMRIAEKKEQDKRGWGKSPD